MDFFNLFRKELYAISRSINAIEQKRIDLITIEQKRIDLIQRIHDEVMNKLFEIGIYLIGGRINQTPDRLWLDEQLTHGFDKVAPLGRRKTDENVRSALGSVRVDDIELGGRFEQIHKHATPGTAWCEHEFVGGTLAEVGQNEAGIRVVG